MSIEKRLKEERELLGFNQADFAGLAGRTKKTMIDYEKGKSSPDARFLAAIAAAGADVQYILTGIRGRLSVPQEQPLTPRQQALLNNYQHSDETGRRIIEATASAAAEQEQEMIRKSA